MTEMSYVHGASAQPLLGEPIFHNLRRVDPLERRVSTVGRVHPHVEIKIVAAGTGAIVPRGAAGELCPRGYIVMRVYWNNDEATRDAIDPARWMLQVIGVPSEKYGEEVMAWVKLREGATVTGDELAAWSTGKVASYKIPRFCKFVDAFPMTVTGKIQKFKMREVAVEELGLSGAAGTRTA